VTYLREHEASLRRVRRCLAHASSLRLALEGPRRTAVLLVGTDAATVVDSRVVPAPEDWQIQQAQVRRPARRCWRRYQAMTSGVMTGQCCQQAAATNTDDTH